MLTNTNDHNLWLFLLQSDLTCASCNDEVFLGKRNRSSAFDGSCFCPLGWEASSFGTKSELFGSSLWHSCWGDRCPTNDFQIIRVCLDLGRLCAVAMFVMIMGILKCSVGIDLVAANHEHIQNEKQTKRRQVVTVRFTYVPAPGGCHWPKVATRAGVETLV